MIRLRKLPPAVRPLAAWGQRRWRVGTGFGPMRVLMSVDGPMLIVRQRRMPGHFAGNVYVVAAACPSFRCRDVQRRQQSCNREARNHV